MAEVKITGLPAATAVTSDDLVPIVDADTTTQKATFQQVLDYVTGSTFNDLTVTSLTASVSGALVQATSITGSTISASNFYGDGTGITGVTAEWDGTHVGDAQITGSLYVTQTISGSALTGSSVEATQITGSVVSASNFYGDGAGITNLSSSLASVVSRGNSTTGSIVIGSLIADVCVKEDEAARQLAGFASVEDFSHYGSGVSVASASSGIYVVVGALCDDTGSPSTSCRGSAFLYRMNPETAVFTDCSPKISATRDHLFPSDQPTQTNFGNSVDVVPAVDGVYILVGAAGEDGAGTNDGAAYLYHSTSAGITEQKLTASDPPVATQREFGYSVSIASGTDGVYALCGARRDDAAAVNAGAMYLYHSTSAGVLTEQKMTASDGAVADSFGYSVSIASGTDGVYALAGAWSADAGATDNGAAYLYHSTSAGLLTEQKMTASDGGLSTTPKFGISVSVVSGTDGIYSLVGAYADDVPVTSSGAAYIIHSTSAGMTEQRLTASDALDQTTPTFGNAVSIVSGSNGIYAMVGADRNDDVSTNSGAAYLYYSSSSGIITEQKIFDEVSSSTDKHFGNKVSIVSGASGIYAAISEYAGGSPTRPAGSIGAYLYDIYDSSNQRLNTDSYTLSSEDRGKTLLFSSSATQGITCSSGFDIGYNCTFVQLGSGQLELTASVGVSLLNRQSHTKSAGLYAAVSVVIVSADTYILAGDTSA